MSKDDQNPYESPAPIREAQVPDLRWSLRATIVVLVLGLVLTAIAPVFGVIATLVCVPAVMRATRIAWRMRQAGDSAGWLNWMAIGLLSIFVIVPLAIASGVAFCCVCIPVGFVGFNIAGALNAGGALFIGFVYVGLYAGIAAGLFVSTMLLRRFQYLSRVERRASELAAFPVENATNP